MSDLKHIVTVSEFIEFLKDQPQDAIVCHGRYSEQICLDLGLIELVMLCEPRPDGWVQSQRPDMKSIQYLMLPGN